MIVTRWEQVQVGCILQWHHPQRDLTLPSGFSVDKQKAQLASLRQPPDSTSMESEVLRLEAGDVIWFLTQEPESRRNYMWFRHRATPVIPAFVRWDTCGLVSNPSPTKRNTQDWVNGCGKEAIWNITDTFKTFSWAHKGVFLFCFSTRCKMKWKAIHWAGIRSNNLGLASSTGEKKSNSHWSNFSLLSQQLLLSLYV